MVLLQPERVVADWLCYSYVSPRLRFCMIIIFKVSMSLGLEITYYVAGEGQPHMLIQWQSC